jgi:hypothetical protein
MTVDFPTDFVNHFLGIPEDMRREALEQLMNQSERAALASTTDVEHEMDSKKKHRPIPLAGG